MTPDGRGMQLPNLEQRFGPPISTSGLNHPAFPCFWKVSDHACGQTRIDVCPLIVSEHVSDPERGSALTHVVHAPATPPAPILGLLSLLPKYPLLRVIARMLCVDRVDYCRCCCLSCRPSTGCSRVSALPCRSSRHSWLSHRTECGTCSRSFVSFAFTVHSRVRY
jgi:hypothetical protein